MRHLAIALIALLLAGCGPIYDTTYRYLPPSDPLSRPCITQCLTSRDSCRNVQELKAENSRLRCERDAGDDFERCLFNAKDEQGKNSCRRRTCSESTNLGVCEADYRVCFQSCGGIVEEERVCTFNCP
jgi:hypothetical protein